MRKLRNIFFVQASILLVVFCFFRVDAATSLYEQKTEKVISKGVYYELLQKVTNEGLLDVHVITVDLTQSHIEVKPVGSKIEHGLKETTSNLVRTNSAIAGVNGDFFGMAGAYSAPMGLEITNGKITSMSDASNSESVGYATFLLDNENNPMINYIKSNISFWNGGKESFDLYAMNRVTDMILPIAIDRTAYESTKALDERFPNLYKIVVDNDMITYISTKGETVDVPEDGFVIVMCENTANYNLHNFKVGETGRITTYTGLDLTAINTAISGGSKILENGKYTESGFIIKGRNPRTAIGITQDNKKLIIMVVDGRTHSIGATHSELAELLLRYGTYNAMHFDGGGSSTMAFKESKDDYVTTRNTVSDGAERKVINALGVFNKSVVSDIKTLEMETESYIAFKNAPVKISVYGFDEYLNKIPVNDYQIVAEKGQMKDEYFYPTETGSITLNAVSSNLIAEKRIKVVDLAQVNSNVSEIKVPVGSEYTFQFTGISTDGYNAKIDGKGFNYEVFPNDLGVFENGKFMPKKSGVGYIKAELNGIQRYIKVSTGTSEVLINSFDMLSASFAAHPETNTGSVSNINGSIAMSYKFRASEETQAAYVVFDTPIAVPNKPIGLKLSVTGDNSNTWLRGRIIDAGGTQYTIDFTKDIDFTGNKVLGAQIPNNVKYPISIDRIYVAALQNTYLDERTLYFDDLVAQYALDSSGVVLPPSTQFSDLWASDLSQNTDANSFDITLVGNIVSSAKKKPANYTEFQNTALTWFNSYAKMGMFIGDTDNTKTNMEAFKTSSNYNVYDLNGVLCLQMTMKNGNMYSSDVNQWFGIKKQLETDKKNIVIIFDKNPLGNKSAKELELFHNLLKSAAENKNIFVVSNEGTKAASQVKDGIRYINIPSLFKDDGTANPDFKVLRLRFSSDAVKYQLK